MAKYDDGAEAQALEDDAVASTTRPSSLTVMPEVVEQEPGTSDRRVAPARSGGVFRAAALEAGLVVLGVVLAFVANEWREHRAAVRRAEHAISSIVEELRVNREAVASSLEYHSGLLAAIEGARQSGVTPGIRTFPRGFISPARVYRTAWDSASATGALELVDYPTLLRLSRAYAQQGRYEAQADSIGPLLYAEIYRGGMASVLANYLNLSALIRAFEYRERELLAVCDQTLAEVAPQ